MSDTVLARVWEGAGETWEWLRGVILGEWQDDRSLSQIVTDALAGFVPGLGSIITLRDLLAVIVRLAKHPEKRAHVDEWILLIAMLLPLIMTVVGVAAAGVGALVGAELGGFLRAVALFVVKKGGVGLKALVEFFQAHGYGHVVNALKEVKFARYKDDLLKGLNQQIDKLLKLVREFEAKLRALHLESLPAWVPGRAGLIKALEHCQQFIKELEALRKVAVEMIPKALIEMDQRLAALLAGDIKAATQVSHTVVTGKAAPAVGRAVADPKTPGMGHSPTPPDPGNTRRVPERRLAPFYVAKHQQEFQYVNSKGIPVGAKPYHEGKTVVENPKLEEEAWDTHAEAVKEGYPDLTAPDYKGRPTTKYDTFADLKRADLKPGDKIVRIVAQDADAYSDYGEFWTRSLPESGREMRAGTAVKEAWNKNGSYVEMTVPPKGHPVWNELGQDPNNPVLKGWEGKASSQVYEFRDPKSGSRLLDDAYLPGGDQQLLLDGKQLAILKKHGFISDRKPTNFKDYDPDVVNIDGSKGNIVPSGDVIFENLPEDRAVIRANAKGMK